MKPDKLSPFAESNVQRLKPVQQQAVREAIVRLSESGLHQSELQVHRLPSGLGYVVAAGKSGRLTVLHSGGGNLLVDDVFVAEDGCRCFLGGGSYKYRLLLGSTAAHVSRHLM